MQQYQNIDANGNVKTTGFTSDVMKILMQKMNFTRKVIEPPDAQWGIMNENGKFNGIVGQLENEMGDFSSAGLNVILQRSQVIDFGVPFYQSMMTMIRKKSQRKPAINLLVFAHIFHPTVWLIIITSILIYSLTYIFINFKHNDQEPTGIIKAIAINLRILIQLNYPIKINTKSTKIFFLTICLSSFILFSFYTADLTSLMTSGPIPNQIRSLSDAYDVGLSVLITKGTALQTVIE